MAEHPNAVIVRESIEAMNRGDFDAAMSYVADDVVWHYIGESEPIRGKAAMTEMTSASDWTITGELHDLVANDDHTIALVKAHAVRGDRTLDYQTAEIYHIKDGKCTERWAFSDDTARIVEFFS